MNLRIHRSETATYPEAHARFSIRAPDLDLETITLILGVPPSATSRAGSRSKDPPIPKVDQWILKSKAHKTADAIPALVEFLDEVEGLEDRIRQVSEKYPDAVLEVVLVIYLVQPDNITPDLTFSGELLARLARLRMQFAISLYVTEVDE